MGRRDQLVLDDGSTHSATELFKNEADARTQEAFFPHGLQDAFALATLDFLVAIAGRRDPEASGREGLFDLAAAFAICESAELRRPVGVDEVLNGSVAGYQSDIDRHFGLV